MIDNTPSGLERSLPFGVTLKVKLTLNNDSMAPFMQPMTAHGHLTIWNIADSQLIIGASEGLNHPCDCRKNIGSSPAKTTRKYRHKKSK